MEQVPDLDLSELQRICRMGRACRICDRKFFLRQSFEAQLTQLDHHVHKTIKVDVALEQAHIELDEVHD